MVKSLAEKSAKRTTQWFRLGLAGILLLSLGLRFWQLGRFNTLVFDETYFVKFANNYLTHTPFFDVHPPLGKYLIAIGIWIGGHLPIGQDTVNSLAGSPLTTWSYRWLNALTGSLIPLVVAAIAYQLSRRRIFSLLAGLFAAVDGLFLVESRYALLNVYLVLFGLLGQWFLLLALQQRNKRWRLCLALSGLCFGASASVKWSGLWFLLGAYLLWILTHLIQWIEQLHRSPKITVLDATPNTPLQRLAHLKPIDLLLNLGAIPALIYQLMWIPHLMLNPGSNIWELHKQILTYHENLGSDAHPYCSKWNSWLLMVRPIAYFYKQVTNGTTDPASATESTLAATSNKVIYDVHAMGNPILWWLSTLAIMAVLYWLLDNMIDRSVDISSEVSAEQILVSCRSQGISYSTNLWIALYLFINYSANLLPWAKVSRCAFLYHYMGSAVFATLALAWLIDRCLCSDKARIRTLGLVAILLILIGFIFWLPIYLGLPLSPSEFRFRIWFPTWI